jgi:prepilin-type processing-associated H-X9-DG protein
MVTGPGTAFEKEPVTLSKVAKEWGTWTTVFWIEAGEAVPWTKPDEFEVSPDRPLPPVGGIFNRNGWVARRRNLSDGTHIAFADGSVRFLRRNVPEETWKELLQRGGAEKVDVTKLFE